MHRGYYGKEGGADVRCMEARENEKGARAQRRKEPARGSEF